MSFLLDTNVISEIRRKRDPTVQRWASAVPDSALYLSVLTVGEIRKGIERLRPRDPDQADVFTAWLTELGARFADRIIPIDIEIAHQWGRLNAASPRNTVDSLIAATALVHDLTVVTRNTPDFEGCGLRLLNPWETPPES
ncbi:MAG TPA: type II toxin-antitoxin system VapC family toxin [Solirubrobacteraceae bacterium]|nr:type II toxin-antitoxin system VapC family toxin [Solirubrobacteraceae bacterium]